MKTLAEAIRPTTLLKPEKLRDLLEIDLTVASETFQHTGSFKFRAAYNVALKVENDQLLTASSGNFGQALAYACKLLGKKCTVIMPETSAKVKINSVRGYGARVDLIDVTKVSRNDRVHQLAAELPDAYFASPYDDQFVIEGNSSLGDELVRENFDIVLAPIGGGGMISGLIRAFLRVGSETEIVGCEPALGNDAARSLKAGTLIANEHEPATMADGARTLCLGKLNWEIIKASIGTIVEVEEEKIAEAVRLYFDQANLKCEPTGALSLAAVLQKPTRFTDKKVCVIVTGGNVDPSVYSRLIS